MLPDNETLTGLLRSAARGCESSFSDLVRHFERPVYNMAMQVLSNREDALDASQEVFIKLWRSCSTYRGECSVASWIIRIARNTSLDFLRRRGIRQTDSLTVEDSDEDGGRRSERDIPVAGGDDDPVAVYERKERIEEVRRAISELGDEHREIIVLRDINGMSYSEISQTLGIEEGTVKSRLNRARNSLKEILEKRNII